MKSTQMDQDKDKSQGDRQEKNKDTKNQKE